MKKSKNKIIKRSGTVLHVSRRRTIKELLTEADLTTEGQLEQHTKQYGKCESRCGSLCHYHGRKELLRWLRESLDKRIKEVIPLDDLEW